MDRRFLLQLTSAVATGLTLPAAAEPRPALRRANVVAQDGVRLHHVDWGQGKPVVLLHSWAMASDMWDYQVAALGEAGFRAIAYDRRGHGRSEIPSGGYDYDTLADDLASVLNTLDLRGVTLVGHSMGCGEIVRYLSRHGAGRVDRIVLLAPTTPGLLKGPDNPNGLDPAMFEAVRAAWRQDFRKWMDDNTAAFLTPQTSPGMTRWLTDMMMRTPLEVALACNRAVIGTDFRRELPGITTPTLILHGDKDASAPLDLTGRPTAALIPGSRLTVIPGAPHGLFATHRDEVNARMLAFMQA